MFTTPCFIRKNTSELREKLEKLGYTEFNYMMSYPNRNLISNHCIRGQYSAIDINFIPKSEAELCIDCGINEELFIALAALRDDTIENQWFVSEYDKRWYICNEENRTFICSQSDMHKATSKEIIEHFNN